MHFDLFDGHNDTILEMKKGENLYNTECEFSFEKASVYNSTVAVSNICPASINGDKWSTILEKLSFFATQEDFGIFKIIRKASDFSKHKNSVIIGIEGAEALNKDLKNLDILYNKGVRCMTLTWNNLNGVSDTNCTSAEVPGLTRFGRELVLQMQEKGIMIDLSHISEKGFYDVLELATKPVIASHSNSYAVCPHSRNLTDEQFKALISSGGVAGINYCSNFLNSKTRAKISDIIKHIEHFMELGGENNVGFGADFDGVDGNLPAGINGVRDHLKVINELLKLNYSEEIIRKITFHNFKRVFEKVI